MSHLSLDLITHVIYQVHNVINDSYQILIYFGGGNSKFYTPTQYDLSYVHDNGKYNYLL